MKLVSTLGNGDGGSIFIGVTDTDTPYVEGYPLDSNVTLEQLGGTLSDIIEGNDYLGASIFDFESSTQLRYWRVCCHSVWCSTEGSYVIEIRVWKWPGGMFCAMPVCFLVDESGDMYRLRQFQEWKDKLFQSYKPEPRDPTNLEAHFDTEPTTDTGEELPLDLGAQPMPGTGTSINSAEKDKDKVGQVEIFQWWMNDEEPCTSGSLRFHHCCARDLADEVMDLRTPFTFYPSIAAAMARLEDITGIKDSMQEIERRYQHDSGAAVILDNTHDTWGGRKPIEHGHLVCSVVVIRESSRPTIIAVVTQGCLESDVKQFVCSLACQLKRQSLLTYRNLCDSTTTLCFELQLYSIGKGFQSLEEKIKYPQEYHRPTMGTLDILRHVLARQLLHCEPFKNRIGDVMVRHLSACQARVLWNKRSKVTVVEGKAGTGKSVLALEMIRRITRHQGAKSRVAFMCRGGGLAAFVGYQIKMMGADVNVHIFSEERIGVFNEDFFLQYSDVLIDDAHTLPMTGSPNCQGMYESLFASLRKPNSRAYIFLDPHMQDYRGCIPVDFTTQIRAMALKYPFIKRLGVRVESLGKILRNSSRICQFVGTNMANDDMEGLPSIRNLPEDGVFFYFIQGRSASSQVLPPEGLDDSDGESWSFLYDPDDLIDEEEDQVDTEDHDELKKTATDTSKMDDDENSGMDSGEVGMKSTVKGRSQSEVNKDAQSNRHTSDDERIDNGTGTACTDRSNLQSWVSRLEAILKEKRYTKEDIAILTENHDDKKWVEDMLACKKSLIQDASSFPVQRIVVDTLENFEGLESPVILFIVPESWGTGYVGSLKYRLCIVTRAISRLEFLVPWDQQGGMPDVTELREAFETKVRQ